MKKRNVIIIISLFIFVVIALGVSYSFFAYNRNVADLTMNPGNISLDVTNISGNLTLTNVVPMTDLEGKITGNYIDFTVTGTVDTDDISYEIYIMPRSGNTLDTSYLKTYLTDQSDTQIQGVTTYSSLSNSEKSGGKALYTHVINANLDGSAKAYSQAFRLRLWLDSSYSVLTSKTFSFDLYVYAKNV